MHIEKLNYNSNELEIYQLIIDWEHYFLDSLENVFYRSETFLKNESLTADIEAKNNPENYPYISPQNPAYYIINPDIQALRKAHFITIHSEFEKLFEEILLLVSNNFNQTISFKFTQEALKNTSDPFSDFAKSQNYILIYYNQIRNRIIHGAEKGKPILVECLEKIDNKEISGVTYREHAEKIYFTIESDLFIKGYQMTLLNFLDGILNLTKENRKI